MKKFHDDEKILWQKLFYFNLKSTFPGLFCCETAHIWTLWTILIQMDKFLGRNRSGSGSGAVFCFHFFAFCVLMFRQRATLRFWKYQLKRDHVNYRQHNEPNIRRCIPMMRLNSKNSIQINSSKFFEILHSDCKRTNFLHWGCNYVHEYWNCTQVTHNHITS